MSPDPLPYAPPHFHALPPPGPVPPIDPLVVGEKPTVVAVISDTMAGIRSHYVRGRSLACLSPGPVCVPGECPHSALTALWRGWLVVIPKDGPEGPRSLALTPHAVRKIAHLAVPGTPTFGVWLRVWRKTDSPQSRMYAELQGGVFTRIGGRHYDAADMVRRMYAGKGGGQAPPAPPLTDVETRTPQS